MNRTKETWTNLFVDEIKKDLYVLLSLEYNKEGLILKFGGNNFNLAINFEGGVDVFRKLDEGACIEIYEKTEELQELRKNFILDPIFIVRNSNFLKELGVLSGGINGGFYSEELGVNHYCIVTKNEIIDIVYHWEPTVEINEI